MPDWLQRNRAPQQGILDSLRASREQPAWVRYGLAVLLVGLAGGCNYLMPPVYGESHYYFFSVAILATALMGGLGPGLFATLFSALISAFCFIAPLHTLQIGTQQAAERLAMFVVEGAIITGVGHVIRENRTLEVASAWRRYALAVLFVAGALTLKFLVFPSVERRIPFTLFYSAVVAAAWLGGPAAGLGAMVLGAVCAYFLFEVPGHESIPGHPDILVFCLEATALCLLTAVFRQRLLRSESYLGRVFEDSPAGMLIIDATGRIIKANPAFEQMLHTDRVGLEGHKFLEFVEPRSSERARGFLATLEQRDTAEMEEVGLVATTAGASVNIRASTMHDGHGDKQTCMLMVEDVTEQLKAEETLRQAEARLARGQRVEAIGMFAGGVAHDFNNLLTVISGSGAQLLTVEGLPAKAREYAAEILETAQTGADLTRRLLSFARRQPRGEQVTAMNGFVMESVTLLGRLLGQRIELTTELSPDAGNVRADPSELQQVLLNLAANARDAMATGGRLTIRTSSAEFGESEAGAPAKQYVVLQVADTGVGMDEATQARIFEPFYSTKEIGKGTGLGLATVQSIVKKLGGFVKVESSPGQGASFWIYLPHVEPEGTSS